MQLTIIANGEELVRRDMLRFAENLRVPQAALLAAGVRLREAIEQQFATEGEHASGGWAPLAESTIREKARKGLRPEILRATDRLMTSLTSKFDPEHVEQMRGPDTLVFGTQVPYATFHQTGTRRMPRRRPVAFTEQDKREIVKLIQAETLKGVRGARGRAAA